MNRNAPHPTSVVEGYYNKFDLKDGAHVVVIICSVRTARDPDRQHMVSFTYHPSHGYDIWQRQYYDKTINMRRLDKKQGFQLQIPGVGAAKFYADGTTMFDLDFNDFKFYARTYDCTMWSGIRDMPGTETSPEGWLSYLPLPLHWHVSSLRSHGTCELRVLSDAIPKSIEVSGSAYVHQEKNWGNSFPKSHIWVQARDGERGICLAGGAVLPGIKAFLVGYRSEDLNWDFKPPFAMQLVGISPFMRTRVQWDSRLFELDVCSFTQRLVMSANAPLASFFTLGAPFSGGHREDSLGESFRATLYVTFYRRTFFLLPWKELRTEVFERASLEFGGTYFGGMEKEKR